MTTTTTPPKANRMRAAHEARHPTDPVGIALIALAPLTRRKMLRAIAELTDPETGRGPSMAEVGRRTTISYWRTWTASVRHAEKAGLVRRVPTPSRKMRLVLTDLGRKCVALLDVLEATT